MRRRRRQPRFGLAAVGTAAVVAAAAAAAGADILGNERDRDLGGAERRCSALASTRHAGIESLSSTRVPPGRFETGSGQTMIVPGSCRITAVARPTTDSRIGFELWLPDGWNGRYAQLGNGGFAGNIDDASLANEIRRGNAAAMTDTGHVANQFDASWALGHPEKVIDYGYRSIKITADAATALIAKYYNAPPRRRYYIGCSNGGRQALMAAARYPADWDGIIAGSPVIGWTKALGTFAAIQHQLRLRRANWIPAQKLPAIQRAAMAACGSAAQAGPRLRTCRLDVRRLLCRKADTPGCLTPAQGLSLEIIQSGPLGRNGPLYYGFDPRSAAYPDGWNRWIANPDSDAPSQLAFATQAYRYLILDKPGWQVGNFDVNRDFVRASERKVGGRALSDILDADRPDLGAFRDRGGKLIMYIGWADPLLSPAAPLAFYRKTVATSGGLQSTQRFFRLFVVSGMGHCQGGLLPNAFGQAWVAPPLRGDSQHDVRLALEAWVEGGHAPFSLTAAKYEDDKLKGKLVASQQVRAYPAVNGPVRDARLEQGGRAMLRP